MKQTIFIIAFFIHVHSYAQLDQILSKTKKVLDMKQPLTSEEVSKGLKEALINGITKGTDITSKLDGYYKNPEIKIPFPPDVKMVEDKLRMLGMGGEVDKFIVTLNRGAEDAAKEAKPIFIAAIKQMTIDDAMAILKGQPDAATQFLQRTTTAQLKEKFKPVVQVSLDRVQATKYYADLVKNYNRIPFVSKVNPSLKDYATDKAIQGLFTMIAKEEKSIRQDPLARTSDLLQKVFNTKTK